MIKDGERYFIKGYTAASTEEVWDKGEVGGPCSFWTSKDLPVNGNSEGFASVREALDAILKANCFSLGNSWEDWVSSGFDDEPGRFDVDVLVNEDFEASESEIESWKAGKKRLWNCHIVARLEIRKTVPLDESDIPRA